MDFSPVPDQTEAKGIIKRILKLGVVSYYIIDCYKCKIIKLYVGTTIKRKTAPIGTVLKKIIFEI